MSYSLIFATIAAEVEVQEMMFDACNVLYCYHNLNDACIVYLILKYIVALTAVMMEGILGEVHYSQTYFSPITTVVVGVMVLLVIVVKMKMRSNSYMSSLS